MSTDTPPGWDLDWQPGGRSGAPYRWPPSQGATYAEFPLRAAAFVVDVLIVTMVTQLLSQMLGLAVFWFQRGDPSTAQLALDVASTIVPLGALVVTAASVYFWRVFRATPGQMVFRVFVVKRGTGTLLSRRAAVVRWLLLYAPLALVVSYSSLSQLVAATGLFDAVDPLLVAAAGLLLPLVWYLVLAISTLAEHRRARGLHDRVSGSVVVRRAGPPA